MECQHVQQLLAFADRKCEELDGSDRDAIRQHLETCPACAELAQAERHTDDTLGAVLRDVAVPADLKQKVMNRLAAERGSTPWKWGAALVIAAAVLIASGTAWYKLRVPSVTLDTVREFSELGAGWDEDRVQKYFADNGLRVVVPTDLDYANLRHIGIVEFQKQRVARLSFQAGRVQAEVLILPHRQFGTDQLPSGDGHGFTDFQIVHKENFTYVIFYRGELDALRRPLN
jgi:anti-sigma factor (TIGR02949 family)